MNRGVGRYETGAANIPGEMKVACGVRQKPYLDTFQLVGSETEKLTGLPVLPNCIPAPNSAIEMK